MTGGELPDLTSALSFFPPGRIKEEKTGVFSILFLHCAWGGQEDPSGPSCQSPRQRGSPLDSPPRARTRAAIIFSDLPSGTGLEDSSVLYSPAGGQTRNQGALTAVKQAGAV